MWNQSPGRGGQLCSVILLAGTMLCLAGCGKSAADNSKVDSAAPLPADPVDLTEVRKAFAPASSSVHIYLEETIALLRAKAYADAIEQCQKLARNPDLTSEQKQAIQNLTTKIQALAAGRVP